MVSEFAKLLSAFMAKPKTADFRAQAQMFKALAAENINIQMISTSEIKISVVVEDKYMELAVRALHKAFDLDHAIA